MDEATKEVEAVLKKHNAEISFQIDFPRYRDIPAEVKLALRVIKNHGMTITMVIQPK